MEIYEKIIMNSIFDRDLQGEQHFTKSNKKEHWRRSSVVKPLKRRTTTKKGAHLINFQIKKIEFILFVCKGL